MAIVTARPTVIQRTQLGIESTYGTPVAASFRLPSLQFKPSPKAESMEYAMQGRSFPAVVSPNREWASGTLEGPMTYAELPVLYNSLLAAVSPVAGVSGESTSQSWTQAPSLEAQDTPRIFTIEHGDPTASNSVRIPGSVVTGATLEITRHETKVTAETLGLAFVTGFSMTAAGSALHIEDVPILPGQCKWYADSTYASIGVTQLTRVLSSKIAITGRWQPEWVLDGAGSYTQLVLSKPTASVELILEANSTAMAYFTQYRAGTIIYLQMKAIGGIVTGCVTTHYSTAISIPVEIKEPTEYRDEGGVYAIGYTFAMIADDSASGAGFPFQIFTWNGNTVG